MRLEFVDGLRALAALFVVRSHAWLTIPTRREGHRASWLHPGRYAVDLFIVLSGFRLALPMTRPAAFGVLRGGALEFYKRRARRILPPYYFALAASIILIGTIIGRPTGSHWDACLPLSVGAVVSHLLMLQDFAYVPSINHVMWSIVLEWQIYFLLPLMALGWQKIGAPATTAATVAFGYLLFFVVKKQFASFEYVWMFGYIALFSFGTFAAVVAGSPAQRWRRLLHVKSVVAADCGDPQLWVMNDFFMGLLSASLLVLASCPGRNCVREALSVKPLVAVGTFAYSIYLMHAPLLQVVWQYAILPLHAGWRTQFELLIWVGLPVIIGVCYLFFLVCEKPWLVRRPNESMLQVAADAAAAPAP